MAQQLRPEKFGEVPRNLPPAMADFLRKLRDAVEIYAGVQRSQMETAQTPGSQAVTFDDLETLGLTGGISYSKIFMHMGAL